METWETKSKRYRFALQNLFADGPVADGVTRLFAVIRNEGLDEAAALADQEHSESLGLKIRSLRAEEKSENPGDSR
jgi:hypothetical protein